MSNDIATHHLNHLVSINRDAEASFINAADNIRNSELETLFRSYANQHAKFAAELHEELHRLGENANQGKHASDSGTLEGAIHRGWMNLKANLTGHSPGTMLTSCQDGELSAESAYLDAEEYYSSGQTHTLIEKHRKQINQIRTRLTRLVGEVKDGVEFPTNE